MWWPVWHKADYRASENANNNSPISKGSVDCYINASVMSNRINSLFISVNEMEYISAIATLFKNKCSSELTDCLNEFIFLFCPQVDNALQLEKVTKDIHTFITSSFVIHWSLNVSTNKSKVFQGTWGRLAFTIQQGWTSTAEFQHNAAFSESKSKIIAVCD